MTIVTLTFLGILISNKEKVDACGTPGKATVVSTTVATIKCSLIRNRNAKVQQFLFPLVT